MPPLPQVRFFGAQVVRAIQRVDRRVLKGAGLVFSLMVLYLGIKVSPAIVFVLGTCIAMLLFSIYLATWVLRKDEGTADMQEVRQGGGAADGARRGAGAAPWRCLQLGGTRHAMQWQGYHCCWVRWVACPAR